MAASHTQHDAIPGVGPARDRAALAAHFVTDDADQRRLQRDRTNPTPTALRDFMMIADARRFERNAAFMALRWGGQAIVAAKSEREADALLQQFDGRDEWRIDAEPAPLELPKNSWLDRFRKRQRFAFVARKVLLELPDRPTFRHSYDVRLAPYPGVEGGYCVQKRVPEPEQIRRRLLANLPPDARPDGEGLVRQDVRVELRAVDPRVAGDDRLFRRAGAHQPKLDIVVAVAAHAGEPAGSRTCSSSVSAGRSGAARSAGRRPGPRRRLPGRCLRAPRP